MRTHMVRGWIVGLLAALALLLAGAPAVAHSDLESSDPEDGATLASAPAAIALVFNEEILAQGNAVTLTHVAADRRLEVGPVVVDGDTVSVTWPESSPAGEFRAAYRVVSADGHPINGTITFTVQEAVGSAETAPPDVSVSPGATEPGPDAGSASPAAVSPAASAPLDDGAGAGIVAWVLGIGLAVLLGAGAGAWVMRRTR